MVPQVRGCVLRMEHRKRGGTNRAFFADGERTESAGISLDSLNAEKHIVVEDWSNYEKFQKR